MFEDRTYDVILEETLDNAPEGIDTRQGSIFYDAISAVALKVAELYVDLNLVHTLSQINTATGEYLDDKVDEQGINRHAATPVQYYFNYTGTRPETGERFFYDGVYFVLIETTDEVLYLECETPGAEYNFIESGTAVVPVNNIEGLTSATIGEVYEYGTNEESDEDLRERVQSKVSGPAENNNKAQYKTWCESIEGVGIARIVPLWLGPNTVKGVLINSEGLPCGNTIVAAVQEYVDPATQGYTALVDGVTYVVGDGLGEGVSDIGAHFSAVAATAVTISVSADIELADSYSIEDAIASATAAITEYLKSLVLNATSVNDVIVRLSAIGSVLTALPDILDYSNLKINGGTSNITPGEDGVPVIGEVTFSAII